MKYFALFLLILSSSAFADQEFYLGDTASYAQEHQQPSGSTKLPTDAELFSAGMYSEIKVGSLSGSPVAVKITGAEVWIDLSLDKGTLRAEQRQKFLAGAMVTLSSGRRIQLFRSRESSGCQLLLYSPTGGLLKLIYLIPKKT